MSTRSGTVHTWGDVDAGYHETAQSCFHLALHCAEEARDWDLRAEALTDMSQQAVDLGQLDHATSLIELAQVRADRVSGTSRAMMSCAHARVLGIAGQVVECRGAVAVSEDYFANHESVTESAKSSYFRQASEGYLTLDNGHALFPLGLGDAVIASLASEKLRAALGHPGIARRRRAMGTAKLATLQLLHGDRDEGIGLAHRAINLGGDMRSARLFGDLRRLRTAATRHTGASVDALRQQLDSVLVSG